jgi:hypothetical protein
MTVPLEQPPVMHRMREKKVVYTRLEKAKGGLQC